MVYALSLVTYNDPLKTGISVHGRTSELRPLGAVIPLSVSYKDTTEPIVLTG